MLGMRIAKPFREQRFDRRADQLFGCVAEQPLDLLVDEDYRAGRIDDDRGVWRQVEQRSSEVA